MTARRKTALKSRPAKYLQGGFVGFAVFRDRRHLQSDERGADRWR